jgi:hypothetical protein
MRDYSVASAKLAGDIESKGEHVGDRMFVRKVGAMSH